MLWVPQVAGSPDVAGNEPRDYWPGSAWVDWVGTDFYGKYPNFSGLTSFYNAFAGQPFVFGEWALWGSDDPAFVDALFGWIGSHPRTRMLIYNQGITGYGAVSAVVVPACGTRAEAAAGRPSVPGLPPRDPRLGLGVERAQPRADRLLLLEQLALELFELVATAADELELGADVPE